ncbi:MAG: hypothetical protein WKG07_01240 [Hymenobacter sp.]
MTALGFVAIVINGVGGDGQEGRPAQAAGALRHPGANKPSGITEGAGRRGPFPGGEQVEEE